MITDYPLIFGSSLTVAYRWRHTSAHGVTVTRYVIYACTGQQKAESLRQAYSTVASQWEM